MENKIKFISRILHISKKRSGIKMILVGCAVSTNYSVEDIQKAYLAVGEKAVCLINLKKVYKKKPSTKRIMLDLNTQVYSVFIPYSEIFSKEIGISTRVNICLVLENQVYSFPIRLLRKKKDTRKYYLPFAACERENQVSYFRASSAGNIWIVKKSREPEEDLIQFKLMENRLVSILLYTIGILYRACFKKNINLFFEKGATKAEEGVYEIVASLNETASSSKNYFVISGESNDFKRISGSSFVLRKYSLRYYLYLYLSSSLIATEAPMHINILRTKNRVLRKALYKKKFVFLQHGILFMKNISNITTFGKGKEAEPDFIIASSELERSAINETLGLDKYKVKVTGLAMFDKVECGHINQSSEDVVAVMLTWKPYEEHLEDFEESTYYKNSVQIFKLLQNKIQKSNVIIIPHPKVREQLLETEFSDNIYMGKVSEILKRTKLLITDYSSVCYNSFYRGAGVLFYQEDIEKYEQVHGNLIPKEDEYIGYRSFNLTELDRYLGAGIEKGEIDLSFYRLPLFEKNYYRINEFCDGKNTDRIISFLKTDGIV